MMEPVVKNTKTVTYETELETGETVKVEVYNTDGQISCSVSAYIDGGLYLNKYLFHSTSIPTLEAIQRSIGSAIKLLDEALVEATKNGD